MVKIALFDLKERTGSSLHAIQKYIINNFPHSVDARMVRHCTTKALKKEETVGNVTRNKNSFKLTEVVKKKMRTAHRKERYSPSRAGGMVSSEAAGGMRRRGAVPSSSTLKGGARYGHPS